LQVWPRPIPPVVGIVFDDAASGALACWDKVSAIAPDGHDIQNDTLGGKEYLIADISPPVGAPVGRGDEVTVHVIPEEVPPISPALHPCDWITDAEAASILGQSSSTSDPTGDETGSVTPFCNYTAGSMMVTSQLHMPQSFAVDAASDFNMGTEAGAQSSDDVSGLPGPARCTTAHREAGELRTIKVLLSGDRIYSADGLNVSCDDLKQFAQAAIIRIGA
jgi:hypothetical protein